MADESTIRAILSAHAALTALVGTRIYDQVAPTNLATPIARPYMIATTVADVPNNTVSDAPTHTDMRIQFDVYADSKAAAKAVLAQVIAALHAAGYVGSEQLTRDLPAGDPALRRISTDWLFVLAR